MNIKFSIKAGKKDLTSIYVRIYHGKLFDQEKKTPLKVIKSNWSDKKQRIKNISDDRSKDLINSKLKQLESFLFEEYRIDSINEQFLPKNWLSNKLIAFFNYSGKGETHKVFLSDFAKIDIQKVVDGKRLNRGNVFSKQSVKNYQTALNKILEYETHKGEKIRFSNLNLEFYYDFIDFCQDYLGHRPSTTGFMISKIKSWCKLAEIEGIKVNSLINHPEFVAPSYETENTYLNNEEINRIFEYDFSKSERLKNTQELFIIGLRTGLRISDFMRLENINLKDGFIEIATIKTNQKIKIPIHQQVRSILNKNNNEFPKSISEVNFNKYVKELCKIVGLNDEIKGSLMDSTSKRKKDGIYPKYKLISSHTCRRSFATNLYGKISNYSIMGVTGHKTEKNFLKYIKITPEEHANTLAEYWGNQN